jgi:DNA polymerase-1
MLIGFDLKQKFKELIRAGKNLPRDYFDLGVAFWLLDPDGYQYIDKSKTEGELYALASEKLRENNLEKIFYEIEMPLLKILAGIEERGIGVDAGVLQKLEKELDGELAGLVAKIYKIAGREFNLNSPKQLGEILFDALKIRPRRKTKTGGRSTSAESLAEMAGEHEIVPEILKYREFFKLRSTYVSPLLELAAKSKDGRIHTNYLQTGTATGRLSSENPNLQNIPTGSEYARRIRSAFVAAPRHSFLSLDYSQIELRVLAHVSGDPKMIAAFKKDEDIHKVTAANVFNVPINEVTPEMRSAAKTLNFGVIYGMGPQAFARAANKTYEEATRFIDEYFNDFVGVRIWQDKVIDKAKQTGYVENLNGRKRWLPNIGSYSPRLAAEARRAGINMPIQGLAADIIKLAMIRVAREAPEAKLLLTIHDELVFEAPVDMLKVMGGKIKQAMESAYALSIPLKVDVAHGNTWADIS